MSPANVHIGRRRFLEALGAGAATMTLNRRGWANQRKIPAHLEKRRAAWQRDPRKAAIDWFKDARFGLFLHYGLYSQLGRGEWVQLREKIPVAEYAKLKDTFTAEDFDADAIAELALAAEMRYVNITSRHHDSFCLFRTKQTDFNSVNSPAQRDLIAELAEACNKRGLGLFLYYSYACDWRHPYFYSRDVGWRAARPAYKEPQPEYKFEKDADFKHYIDFAHAQLRELLTQYGPLAGIWLDPIMGYYSRPDLFPIDETYRLIRSLQPGCLISFKQGANGDEDFAAPERTAGKLTKGGEVAARAWAKNKDKPIEICNTLQPRFWGYDKSADGKHRKPDEVRKMLAEARDRNANVLLNSGPLPTGAIPPEDVHTLTEVGHRLRAERKGRNIEKSKRRKG